MVCCTSPAWKFSGVDLPQLLEADAVFLRVAAVRAARTARSAPWSGLPRAPSANSVYLARSSMPRVKPALWCPSRPMPMSPVATPATAPFSNKQLGGGEARIDLDAERFRLLRQPAADVAERDDEIAVIAHQRRHQQIRQPHARRRVRARRSDRRSTARLAPALRRCAIPACSRSSPIGSMTAPDRICAPTSEPFSTTTTEASGAICLSLSRQRGRPVRRRR